MSSIIEGYNYDIFISYRQKDNKYDGWVTEFVDNLKKELEATFKEEISVYFDINPHNGLLETYNVDASLKEKLSCLIFIPILSRTYCDPKSFAWENEFKAFAERALQDQFGLMIKLPNGNVASRVLPVQIHDLDTDDIRLCESILGEVLRGVEFIYKSPGINRPLRSKEDKPHDNLNKTIYRDQINKVALAIKELIKGMKGDKAPGFVYAVKEIPSQVKEMEVTEHKIKDLKTKPAKLKLFPLIVTLAIVITLSIVLYPILFKSSNKKVAITVMPFQNMTNDTSWNVYQEGIQFSLISGLTKSEDFSVKSMETVTRNLESKGITDFASITPAVSRKVSQELSTDVFVQGSIIRAGEKLRITGQVIDSKSEDVLTSFPFECPVDQGRIMQVTDSLSRAIRNYLMISKLRKTYSYFTDASILSTKSPDALKYYLYGLKAYSKDDYHGAIRWYMQSIEADSNFIAPLNDITWAHMNLGLNREAKEWGKRYFSKRDLMDTFEKGLADVTYLSLYGTLEERVKLLRQLVEVDESFSFLLGTSYSAMGQYNLAAAAYEKEFELLKKDKITPWLKEYLLLGDAYRNAKQYEKAINLYKEAEKVFPESGALVSRNASLSLIQGDTAAAGENIRKYIRIRREKKVPELMIKRGLADIYMAAGNFDKAEIIIRNEVLPFMTDDAENAEVFNLFAWFLIDNNRNINDGLTIIDRALKFYPDNPQYIDTRGWGLYKLGKYQEALTLFQKSSDLLLPEHNEEIDAHLEAAKKAVAEQK